MAEKLFSPEQKAQIVSAIKKAETNTSGEIQVHIENHCKGEVLDRAADGGIAVLRLAHPTAHLYEPEPIPKGLGGIVRRPDL